MYHIRLFVVDIRVDISSGVAPVLPLRARGRAARAGQHLGRGGGGGGRGGGGHPGGPHRVQVTGPAQAGARAQ